MPMRVPHLTWACIFALSGWTVASIPYTDDGVNCVSADLLQNRGQLTPSSLADCQVACKRVKDTIEAQKAKGCETTAQQIHELMLSVDNTVTLPMNRMVEILKALLDEPEKNCLHDLERHLLNREKFCTAPGSASDVWDHSSNPVLPLTRASAMRRFAFTFLHKHLIKKKQKDHDHQYCFPAMLKILRDPQAAAFTTGKCKSIFTERWQSKNDCSVDCWKSIQDAAAVAGGAKCCLSKYYETMLDFTYGSSKPISGGAWGFHSSVVFGSLCKDSSVPCTSVHEAVAYCIEGNAAGVADAELYLPEYCASSSTLATSMLLSAISAMTALAAVLLRS